MTKLYEVANDYSQALEYLMDPERFQDGLDTLESIEAGLHDKLDSMGKLRLSKLAEAKALEEESKRLKERADRAKKEAASIEGYIEITMRKNGMEKIKTPTFNFGFTVSNSLVVTDLEKLPDHFKKPQPPKPDIAGMKAHIKQKYDELGFKLVNKLSPPSKDKYNEMLVTELELEDLGVQFEISEKLSIK